MNIFLPWKLGFLAMRLQLHLLVKEAPWVGRGQPTRDVAVELLTSIMPHSEVPVFPERELLHTSAVLVFTSGDSVSITAMLLMAFGSQAYLCSWVPWDYKNPRDSSWQTTTPQGTVQRAE